MKALALRDGAVKSGVSGVEGEGEQAYRWHSSLRRELRRSEGSGEEGKGRQVGGEGWEGWDGGRGGQGV